MIFHITVIGLITKVVGDIFPSSRNGRDFLQKKNLLAFCEKVKDARFLDSRCLKSYSQKKQADSSYLIDEDILFFC
ncbi:hypothetical protein B1B04_00960 [Lysinibacillus sp. KCTC 33748]|nr:hypothetical protein B1B04_00960 [Lysinibacillus sp. KCTC 33748]